MQHIRLAAIFFLFGLVGVAIQGAWRLFIPDPPFLCPQILLALVLFLSFFEAEVRGAFIAFMLGLLLDSFSGTLIGPWAGSYVIAYLFFATLSQGIFVNALPTIILGTFVASVLASSLYTLLTLNSSGSLSTIVVGIMIEALSTAVAAPIVFFVVRRILKRFRLDRLLARPR